MDKYMYPDYKSDFTSKTLPVLNHGLLFDELIKIDEEEYMSHFL